MKEIITVWLIRKVLIPFAFWLDDEHHRWCHKTMKEYDDAKAAGLSLSVYRRIHRLD